MQNGAPPQRNQSTTAHDRRVHTPIAAPLFCGWKDDDDVDHVTNHRNHYPICNDDTSNTAAINTTTTTGFLKSRRRTEDSFRRRSSQEDDNDNNDDFQTTPTSRMIISGNSDPTNAPSPISTTPSAKEDMNDTKAAAAALAASNTRNNEQDITHKKYNPHNKQNAINNKNRAFVGERDTTKRKNKPDDDSTAVAPTTSARKGHSAAAAAATGRNPKTGHHRASKQPTIPTPERDVAVDVEETVRRVVLRVVAPPTAAHQPPAARSSRHHPQPAMAVLHPAPKIPSSSNKYKTDTNKNKSTSKNSSSSSSKNKNSNRGGEVGGCLGRLWRRVLRSILRRGLDPVNRLRLSRGVLLNHVAFLTAHEPSCLLKSCTNSTTNTVATTTMLHRKQRPVGLAVERGMP